MRFPPDRREPQHEDGSVGGPARLARAAGIAMLFILVGAGLILMGFVVGSWAVNRLAPEQQPIGRDAAQSAPPLRQTAATSSTAVVATADADAAPGDVEVPEVRGQRVDEALVLLQASGFTVVVTAEETRAVDARDRLVSLQSPSAGTIAASESTVTLTAPPLAATPAGRDATATQSPDAFVVCIDPGHQAHNDEKLEPIGPGSKTQRPRATGGATGVATGLPEYEIALQLSMNLKKRLQTDGVHVVLTRTTNDVRLSNAARARIANKVHADLFVRIHCGASTIVTDAGCRTLYPARNRWTATIVSRSRTAAKDIETAAVHATGARNRGAHHASGVVGFNWSKVPVVMVEAGYLSNPIEDRLLASPAYQDRLAGGLADGVLSYLRSKGSQ